MSLYGKPAIRDRRGANVAHGPKLVKNPRTGSVEEVGSHLVGKGGEYNAYSRDDLINILAGLAQLGSSGQLQHGFQQTTQQREAAKRMVTAALADTTLHGGAFEKLGQVVTEQISETMGRLGFTDKVLARQDVNEKGIARVEVDQMDVVCWHMVDGGHVAESLASPKFFYPEMYYLNTLVLVEDADLFFAGQSFLERKHNAGLVGTMVREDNVSRFLFDQAAPIANSILSFGSFTPTSWGALRHQIWRWALNVSAAIIAVDLQQDILADNDWHAIYSPVEQHVLFEEGKFGTIYGTEIYTDGYVYDNLKVLEAGEVYLLSAPATLGVKAVAIPLKSEPVNQYQHGRPVKGWFLEQYQATAIVNSKGVSKGIKI